MREKKKERLKEPSHNAWFYLNSASVKDIKITESPTRLFFFFPKVLFQKKLLFKSWLLLSCWTGNMLANTLLKGSQQWQVPMSHMTRWGNNRPCMLTCSASHFSSHRVYKVLVSAAEEKGKAATLVIKHKTICPHGGGMP